MPHGDVETFCEDGLWCNRVEGEGGILNTHSDKESAVLAGREEAGRRKVEHIIKKLDGTIGERNSHDNDPATSLADPE
jgi:hypothetical protein